jgi:hypothetical protein
VATSGLEALLGAELFLPADATAEGAGKDHEALLAYIRDYIIGERTIVNAGETITYGYWLLRFTENAGRLELWELTPDGEDWVRGAETALRHWREQHAVCAAQDARFAPPQLGQLVVISDGVLEGDPTQGVRYRSPAHMSGWWLSTDRYDGDVASMRNLHAYHVTARRPDLARYLALPFGYRFDEDGYVDFDEQASTR